MEYTPHPMTVAGMVNAPRKINRRGFGGLLHVHQVCTEHSFHFTWTEKRNSVPRHLCVCVHECVCASCVCVCMCVCMCVCVYVCECASASDDCI